MVGDGLDEPAGVGMARVLEHVPGRPFLDDPARIHHGHSVGDARDDREVVRHVDHREAPLDTQATKLLEHVSLGDDVQSGRRLVEHDKRRLARERHRDHDALLLPTRKLMREAAQEARLGRKVDGRESRRGIERGVHVGSMLVQHVAERPADPQCGVERARRVLRDVRDDPTPKAACPALVVGIEPVTGDRERR